MVTLDSVITVKSCSLATPAVWLCCAPKCSLNAAGGCQRTAEHEANGQQSRSGTHIHPVESRGKCLQKTRTCTADITFSLLDTFVNECRKTQQFLINWQHN